MCWLLPAGDGWETSSPVGPAIQNDMAQAEYDGPVNDWVDSLQVYEGDTCVAEWNRRTGWRTL